MEANEDFLDERQIAIEIVRQRWENHPDTFFAKLQIGAAASYGPPRDVLEAVAMVMSAIKRIRERKSV